MPDLELSLACLDYLHVRALMQGRVAPEGIRLSCIDLDPEETHPRMLRDRAFDIAEMGLTFYLGTLNRSDPPFIAIPVFTSRGFRHNTIYVHAASGIESPADLIGRRVGEHNCYGHDAGLWSKGILADEHGVAHDSYRYVVGSVLRRRDRAPDYIPLQPPPSVHVEPAPPDRTLDQMLEAGEIDALFSAVVPPSFARGSARVRRLFPDAEERERDYCRRTGFHPIMHTVVIKREIYDRDPWVAAALMRAFSAAKEAAEHYYETMQSKLHRVLMLAWATELYAANKRLMGDTGWAYGVAANRAVLETALRYHHEQGLSPRLRTAEELFAPEALALEA
jgi:4,5-dihydroxyphthalate decarboxylase